MEAAIGIAILIGWLLCIRWARNTAMARGHSRYLGLVLGFFLGPLGVLVVRGLSPTGGRIAYLGCGSLIAVVGVLGVILVLATSSSRQAVGLLIMMLVVLATGIGLVYRGVTGKEAKLPEDIANPITETALEATAMGLAKGPADAVVAIAQNVPGIYRTLKKTKTPPTPSNEEYAENQGRDAPSITSNQQGKSTQRKAASGRKRKTATKVIGKSKRSQRRTKPK